MLLWSEQVASDSAIRFPVKSRDFFAPRVDRQANFKSTRVFHRVQSVAAWLPKMNTATLVCGQEHHFIVFWVKKIQKNFEVFHTRWGSFHGWKPLITAQCATTTGGTERTLIIHLLVHLPTLVLSYVLQSWKDFAQSSWSISHFILENVLVRWYSLYICQAMINDFLIIC